MCRSRTTVFLSAVVTFSVCIDARLLGDNQPPREHVEESRKNPVGMVQKSDKAVVKDVVYGLELEKNRLHLTSQPLDGADRKAARKELEFTVPEGGRVVEMSLARQSGKNLMVVLKIARGGEFDFHCLGVIAPPGGHVRDEFRVLQVKFFTTKDNLKILAANGTHFSNSVFIVLGNIEYDLDKELMVTAGTFYFSGCPWTPGDGQSSPFRVESVPPKGD